jgi:2-keto-3-deoxy-L-rhamnonate aldolase RhmA
MVAAALEEDFMRLLRLVPWEEHVQTSNDEIVLSVMIEDEGTLDEIDAIAALDGVDIVAIGPADLA